MSFLILMPDRDGHKLAEQLHAIEPDLPIEIWPRVAKPRDVTFAVTWNHPVGALKAYPNLKAASSFGAGVDHFVADKHLPPGLAVCRIVTPQLVRDMRNYLVSAVLQMKKNFDAYGRQQAAREWQPLAEPDLDHICLLGLGQLGAATAESFVRLGFSVSGWSRKPKTIPGVACYHGDQLDQALQTARILICLLPLTRETKGILNKDLFHKLPAGSYLINVARGDHLVEDHLIPAIDAGILSGARLDVFQQEPLPAQHPFWSHPAISITPHAASVTDPREVVGQLLENYHRTCANAPLLHRVDLALGY